MNIMERLAHVINQQRTSGRLWLYSNYHCNLACHYCLTASSPRSKQRSLSASELLMAAQQAAELGFRSIGVTGGEPFLMPNMCQTLHQLADILPVIVLTNGTVFQQPKVQSQLSWLAHPRLQVQVSIDDHEAEIHDQYRGDGSFERAIRAIPMLLAQQVQVRLSSTRVFDTPEDFEAHVLSMQTWMNQLGLDGEELVTRTMVQRGSASEHGLGLNASAAQLPADLTLTREGAYFSPFGPTVRDGRLQTDLLLTRTILPLDKPLRAFLQILDATPEQSGASQAAGFV